MVFTGINMVLQFVVEKEEVNSRKGMMYVRVEKWR